MSSGDRRYQLTTSSLTTTTSPLAIAPIASSSRPGTPSLRTTNTSSGADNAFATSHATGTPPRGNASTTRSRRNANDARRSASARPAALRSANSGSRLERENMDTLLFKFNAMRAMQLTRSAAGRLDATDVPIPVPDATQVLVRVAACGVCRTDLHVVDGELPDQTIPIIPGHEIVGIVEEVGRDVRTFSIGERVGIPWLAWACGGCEFCRSGRENLCPFAQYTGYQVNGGYAEYVSADARFCFPLPANYDHEHVAPLLCAGLIGYRAYRIAGPGRRMGIYGFGAAAHIVAQVAVHQGREVFAFVSP